MAGGLQGEKPGQEQLSLDLHPPAGVLPTPYRSLDGSADPASPR